MPPPQYQLIHGDSKLTHEDVAALLTLLPEATAAGQVGVGDAARGRALFEKRCTRCHALDSNREGPRLRGVYGRKAGSVEGFTYSAALKGSGLTWADTNLDGWLRDSDEMCPKATWDLLFQSQATVSTYWPFLRSRNKVPFRGVLTNQLLVIVVRNSERCDPRFRVTSPIQTRALCFEHRFHCCAEDAWNAPLSVIRIAHRANGSLNRLRTG